MEESKVTRKNRVLVTFDVTEKKIKIPKSLRPEIKSYRRIGFGPNERDVLIGEIVNGKYLVFPLQKEIDLENSELYIVERDPRDNSDDEKENEPSDTTIEESTKESTVDNNKYFLVNVNGLDIRYRVIAFQRVGDLSDKSLFIYDDKIWTMHRTAGRRFINDVNNTITFAEYYKQKYKVNNPYIGLYTKMVKIIEIVSE